ncbi:ABC transporter substrate-binding protein [Candidimonas nitroreducens]|uniref:ABC transporter substrate-binding protein n=2 Tax=Candidimonas nitroreducens TaxID=683354 RepID=A0A225M0E3_9BURK|nr:ABC transporter substrate-binding protein [Candidimonas nitroreducens]
MQTFDTNALPNPKRRRFAAGVALFAVSAGHLSVSRADAPWPDRPIKLVVPFPPGGTTDITARVLARALAEQLKQSVIVENRAGASGNIGSAFVAHARPDGYTLVMSGVGTHAANVALYHPMPYDPVQDFTHITSVTSSPNAIAVNPSFPAKTLAQLVDLIKRNPNKYNYASPGTGSSGNLAVELLKQQAGLQIQHIPYKGAAQAAIDVIGGQIPVLVMVADTLKPQVQAGKLRILATTGAKRSLLFPDIPTVAESGYPGFEAVSWTGLSAPAGLPAAIRDRLFEATKAVLLRPDVIEPLERTGNSIDIRSPQEFTAFIESEIKKWEKVAAQAHLRVS